VTLAWTRRPTSGATVAACKPRWRDGERRGVQETQIKCTVTVTTGWKAEDSGFDSRQEIYLCSSASKCGTGAQPASYMLTTHLQLVLGSRLPELYSHFHHDYSSFPALRAILTLTYSPHAHRRVHNSPATLPCPDARSLTRYSFNTPF
jgi:hypothetical protein